MNNPIDKIQSYYDDLTKTDKEIAIYIINNPREVATKTLDVLAKKTGSSKSALSRFAQRIGYPGFTEFRFEMARFMVSENGGNDEEDYDPVRTITKTYANYTLKLAETINNEQIERVADLFLSSNSVKICGINRSYNSANQFKQRLLRIGFGKVSSFEDNQEITDLLQLDDENDLLIIFSTTDNTKFYGSRLKDAKSKIIFITANPSLPLKKYCDEFVVVPRISRDSYASFLDDQAIFFVLIEILIKAIAHRIEDNR